MSNSSRALRPEWSETPRDDFQSIYKGLKNLHDVAEFWGIPPSQLAFYAYAVDKRSVYSTFSIPRRNGRRRLIEVPVRSLKYIQRIMHESLVPLYRPHDSVHGFLPSRSIITNARTHVGQRYVLNIDLSDFFPSITRKRLFGRLVAEPYALQNPVANLIASLATNAFTRLPQGSPSSPVLANMVTAQMDAELARLCANLRCKYTRYADDITISISRGELSPHLARYPNARGTGQVIIGEALSEIVERHGFQINHRKSRLQSYWTRQMCTGLVVNGDHASPSRTYIRRLRALMDNCRRKGWEEAAQLLHNSENRPLFKTRQSFLNHVNGKVRYVKMVRGDDDPVCRKLDLMLSSISGNE